jgi:hypothetical protein
VEALSYTFRQPYHTAAKMEREEARSFLLHVRDEARKLARDAIRAAEVEAKQQGFEVTRCALLLASGRPLPGLEKILASHSLIHTADGELFREAIVHGSARCGFTLNTIRERELLARGTKLFRCKEDELLRRITELGRQVGTPWSQDEKFAALASWISLAE